MLVKKQIKYFDVPLEHEWKVPVLQELLSTRMNNLYVEGFDDYVITEMINMLFQLNKPLLSKERRNPTRSTKSFKTVLQQARLDTQ